MEVNRLSLEMPIFFLFLCSHWTIWHCNSGGWVWSASIVTPNQPAWEVVEGGWRGEIGENSSCSAVCTIGDRPPLNILIKVCWGYRWQAGLRDGRVLGVGMAGSRNGRVLAVGIAGSRNGRVLGVGIAGEIWFVEKAATLKVFLF